MTHVYTPPSLPPAPTCLHLPHQSRELWSRLEDLKLKIGSALALLPEISEDVDQLVEQAREFYELAPEAAARHHLSMMEVSSPGGREGCSTLASKWDC